MTIRYGGVAEAGVVLVRVAWAWPVGCGPAPAAYPAN